jgi:hypothetical protein
VELQEEANGSSLNRDKRRDNFHGSCGGGGDMEGAIAGGPALVGGPRWVVAGADVDGVGAMGVTGGGTPVSRAMTRPR